MRTNTREFRARAAATMADPRLKSALEGVYEGFHKGRIAAAAATDEWEAQRDRGRAIKEHTIANLDYYLEMLAENVEKNGGHVFFARDADEANRYVLEIVKKRNVRTVIKSKSMVSEEMGLNHALEGVGVEAVETDLGEYIIQLAGETPYHIIAPAIHKSKDEVSELLAAKSGGQRLDRAADLTMQAREQLRDVFKRADMSVTGVNFAVAESGSIVLVTNEGNGRMATSAPRIHVAAMGMEKVVPSIADLSTFLRILIRSATGQRISSYVTMVNGPRRHDDEDGPEEFHLVIIDNNRSKLLADPALREALYCIRCGACMNSCPVYRKVGGHSYGWVYPGPIGAVITPVLTGLDAGKDLPFASTLCGACKEVCPVKIDLPRMLLELRAQAVESSGGKSAGLMWRGWRAGTTRRTVFDAASRVGRWVLRPLTRKGWIRRLPPPLGAWTTSRDFLAPASTSFVSRFNRLKRDKKQ